MIVQDLTVTCPECGAVFQLKTFDSDATSEPIVCPYPSCDAELGWEYDEDTGALKVWVDSDDDEQEGEDEEDEDDEDDLDDDPDDK